MRLLHTADWHVGKGLIGRARLDEAGKALDEVVRIAADEKVDLAVVSGDIFEHYNPAPDAEEIVYDALLRLEQAGIPVVLLAGNHDNPQRWRALEPLLGRVSIRVVPEPRRPEKGGLIELPSRDGSEVLQLAVLPWVAEKRLFGAEEVMGLQGARHQAYAEHMGGILAALCDRFEAGKCHALAAHLFVSGSRLGGGERDLSVGQIYAVTPPAIPTTPQYVALGHVHRPQTPPDVGARAIRYSGSLLQLDFGEKDQRKSVCIAELRPGKPAKVRDIALSAGRRLEDVSGTLAELETHQATRDSAFLRVTVKCEGPQPGLAERVREVLPHALAVSLDYPAQKDEERAPELRSLRPRELFARYLRQRYGTEPSFERLDLFEQVLSEDFDASAGA